MIAAKQKTIKQTALADFIKDNPANFDCENQAHFQDDLEYCSVTYWNPSGKVCRKTDDLDDIEYFIYNDKNFKPVAWYCTADQEGYQTVV